MRPQAAESSIHLAAARNDEVGADAQSLVANRVGNRSVQDYMGGLDARSLFQFAQASVGS